MAVIYKANGERETVFPDNGKDFKLEQLQKIVGGYIDMLGVGGDEIMVFNDEGKLMELPFNREATEIYRKAFQTDDFIVGDVLVCKDNEIE